MAVTVVQIRKVRMPMHEPSMAVAMGSRGECHRRARPMHWSLG